VGQTFVNGNLANQAFLKLIDGIHLDLWMLGVSKGEVELNTTNIDQKIVKIFPKIL
jgi:hypothetical protein